MAGRHLTQPSPYSDTGLEFNLECEHGHRWYAPEPSANLLEGRICNYPTMTVGEAKLTRHHAKNLCSGVLGVI